MLIKIDNCENFGSQDIISKLVKNCNREKVKISDILEFFKREPYSEVFYTEDILKLLSFLDIIEIQKDFITLTKIGNRLLNKNKKDFTHDFKIILASKIFENDFVYEFLGIADISYDIHGDRYVIKSSKIPLKYFALRNLFIKLKILDRIKCTSLIIVNQPIINLLKEKNKKNSKIISLNKLKESLLRKEEYGHEAEEIVLRYELNRLKNHPNPNRIKIISDLDVSAGFDIISFKDNNSKINDLFIEVKSYSGNPYFYWSSNEIDLAKIKGEFYCLYLVNRDEIGKEGYEPQIIINPYKNIYSDSSQWLKEVMSWRFVKI